MAEGATSEFRAFRIHNRQGRIAGQLEELSLSDLSPGEVTIRACWSSVNYKDALAATGAGKIIRDFPRIGGIDVTGTILESERADYRPGQPVLVTGYDLGVGHDGGYADYVRVPAEWVVPLPQGISPWQAAVLGTAGFTVGLCLQRLEDNGQRPEAGPFAVTGATGGVGSLAVSLLHKLGYEVHAVTGKPEAAEYLQALGAAKVIDRRSLAAGGPPLEHALWGGAIDNAGGELLSWLTRTIRPWGNVVSVGLAGGSDLHTTVMPFILRGVSLLGVSSANCPGALRRRVWERLAGEWAPPRLERIARRNVTLEELPEVFEIVLNGGAIGRTLVKLAGAQDDASDMGTASRSG